MKVTRPGFDIARALTSSSPWLRNHYHDGALPLGSTSSMFPSVFFRPIFKLHAMISAWCTINRVWWSLFRCQEKQIYAWKFDCKREKIEEKRDGIRHNRGFLALLSTFNRHPLRRRRGFDAVVAAMLPTSPVLSYLFFLLSRHFLGFIFFSDLLLVLFWCDVVAWLRGLRCRFQHE